MKSVLLLFPLLILLAPASAQKSIPMEADAWDTGGYNVSFLTHRGRAAMRLDDKGQGATGSNMVVARNERFENGTIEYDIALDEGARFSSLYFRMQDPDNTEHVYLRAFFADDPNASGGFQYAAVVDGVNYWDLSFPYQTGVDFRGGGEWNHVKLVVRDRQLLAYVNDMERPALYVPVLDGLPGAGSIGVDGKAWIANLTVTPDVTPGLTAGEGFDPTHNDVRYLRDWKVSSPVEFPQGREPTGDDLPNEQTEWEPLSAEHHGLVNLSRRFGKTPNGERRLVWLKTTLESRAATDRHLDLGISDEVYVYLNGRPLYVGKNPYNTPAMLSPGGRATPENARIPLPLQEGENELLIGVTNYFFGWGIVARLNDGAGLRY
jgi:hypothetical protein